MKTIKIVDRDGSYYLLLKSSEVKAACRYHRQDGSKVTVLRAR